MKESQKKGQKQSQAMAFLAKTAVIGFVGGVFWSLISYLAYAINLTEISPNLILQPWLIGEWKEKMIGNLVSIFLIGLISILAAFVYFVLLKRFEHMWIGILYGLVLWAIVFYILNPAFPNLKTVGELGRNTIITTVCIYILYGVFIGYSISYEAAELENNTRIKEVNE